MHNYIIVGQGIAGTMLSWFLLKHDQQVLVIDEFNQASASKVASGVTNPITGRRFVKSWLNDDLIPFAENTYRELESILGESFYSQSTIVKLFDSVKAQNDWSARCASPEYLPYLQNEQVVYFNNEKVKNNFGGFEIEGGSKLESEKFLLAYRKFLSGKEILLEQKFDFSKLSMGQDEVDYNGHKAQKIIFCEGANALQNPYFKFLPFQPAKGECLIVEIEDFYPDRIINGEVFVMPMPPKNHYYIGATHEWYFDDDKPSAKGRHELLGNLSTVLKAPFRIVEQKAAIRPTVKDRRPFIGFHSEFPTIGIFNGMGTKGISLAPYFAHQFAEYLLFNKPLHKEVDIKRFLS